MPKPSFYNFRMLFEPYQEELSASFERVLRSGRFILGEELAQFEKELAAYLGVKHVIGVGNGTDAITIALKTLDIGLGDEVIVPGFTCQATWLGVAQAGAKPTSVDVDLYTWTLDPKKIVEQITSKTKAIIPVHLYGNPCDMDALKEISETYHIPLVEDNAQSMGSTYGEKKTGTFGKINAHSFYPTKNLGALGDAGAISTDDDALAEKARLWRNYGIDAQLNFHFQGMNSRLDELQAALLRVRLKWIEREIETKHAMAIHKMKSLENIPIQWQKSSEYAYHSYHLLVGRSIHREALLAEFQDPTLIHYPYDFNDWAKTNLLHLPISTVLKNEVFSIGLP